MDLLLHLVSQREVSVEEVQMLEVCEQYLEIVSTHAEGLDLDQAAEYLVIAATLLSIKSGSLLPSESNIVEEEDSAEFEANRFFEDLRSRLQAYEKTKLRAQSLMATPQHGFDTFSRVDRKALLPTPEMLAEPEDMYDLGRVFAKLLKRIGKTAETFRVFLEPISIVTYMMKMVDVFQVPTDKSSAATEAKDTNKARGFASFIRSFVPAEIIAKLKSQDDVVEGREQVRGVVIGTFIATLELVKRGVIKASQEQADAEIVMEFALEENSLDLQTHGFESEFDDETETESNNIVTDDENSLTSVDLEVASEDSSRPSADKVVSMDQYRSEPKSNDDEVASAIERDSDADCNRREVGGA
jgi:segregation and condensation protein A